MRINNALQLLRECGYSIKKNRFLNEMSRASDRTLGAGSNENLLFMLSDWKKTYDRSGKKPTMGQLKKFLDENGYSWEQVASADSELPATISSSSARKFDLQYLLDCLEDTVGSTSTALHDRVNAGKDSYDKLIDTFWDYYEKVHDGADTSEIVRSDNFQVLLSLFTNDEEKAREIFGRNFEKAQGYLAKFLDPDFETSPRGLLSAFWDWHRARKAGEDIDFDPDKAEKLAELLEGPNPEQYFSNKGLYFFVNRVVGNMVGRQLFPADSEFDRSSFEGDFDL